MAVFPTGLSIFWRIALSALVFAYGFACLGSGLDRLSAINPEIEQFVPGPFRAHAETGRANMQITSGQASLLRSASRRAVLANPIERRPVALLGMGHLLAGDHAAATAAFQVGARLGWREPLTQNYWYHAALEAEDFTRAAERVDARLRTQPWRGKMDELLQPLLTTPTGRQALAIRLAYRPEWLRRFLAPPGNTPHEMLANRSEVVQLMARAGHPLSCTEIKPLIGSLSKSGMAEQARALWAGQCGKLQLADSVWDPGFDGLRNARSGGIGWRLHHNGDLSATLVDGPRGNAAIAVRNYGLVTRPALSQKVVLAPGAYRVIVKAGSGKTGTQDQLAPSLTCGNRPERPDPGPANSGRSDIVQASSCKIAIFALWLKPSAETIVISSVQLQKID